MVITSPDAESNQQGDEERRQKQDTDQGKCLLPPPVAGRLVVGRSGGFGEQCEACQSSGSPKIQSNNSIWGRFAPNLVKFVEGRVASSGRVRGPRPRELAGRPRFLAPDARGPPLSDGRPRCVRRSDGATGQRPTALRLPVSPEPGPSRTASAGRCRSGPTCRAHTWPTPGCP